MVRELYKGLHGADVRALQEALNLRYQSEFQMGLLRGRKSAPKIGVDGKFCGETDTAVRDFQSRHTELGTSKKLKVDGVVGRRTRKSLFPLAMASITIIGVRKTPPMSKKLEERLRNTLSPGQLHLDLGWLNATRTRLQGQSFSPCRIPGLPLPIPGPVIPDLCYHGSPTTPRNPLTDDPPPVTPPPGPDLLGDWKFDHREVVPGAQTTFPFNGARQDAFTMTLQMIYAKGDPEGKHLELTPGVQYSSPLQTALSNGSVWSFNPFVQITDVDRFGALGAFHWWQPYAQLGVQVSTGDDINPMITGNLFPINLGLDATDFLTLTAGAGVAFGFNPISGQGFLGGQLTFGANIKFGAPDKRE
jgi:hypothetical protein